MKEFEVSDKQLKKLENLKENLEQLDSLSVSFSGGVDSTFLLAVASEVLKSRVIAVTMTGNLYPKRETDEAVNFCDKHSIPQVLLENDFENIEGFCSNPQNRCYLCKSSMFTKIKETSEAKAFELGIIKKGQHISCAEGSNLSDQKDFRPGKKAAEELGILSPLEDVKLTKDDIRELSRTLKLSTWNKPSSACLASRIPYGTQITNDLLNRINKAEQALMEAGFDQVRVRAHDNGKSARVEVDKQDIKKALNVLSNDTLSEYFHELGFLHVSVDIDGYQTGGVN